MNSIENEMYSLPFRLLGDKIGQRFSKSFSPSCKHGKTEAQRKKEIARRRKRKKNK